ncbi:unnamed protein product [Darwinula stevensoni]|uniref:1-acyl-sn-glycerol-3-phosphate acyltransferase n=1 Tax=Darwinula stevensoni TaxID=69355 RepID=A0A7R9FQB3_9CRUS|nr:unnamed protein product [Darwinula stevensoni]CAG0899424.1 unnamed protein product [Darwinula stevensoni]
MRRWSVRIVWTLPVDRAPKPKVGKLFWDHPPPDYGILPPLDGSLLLLDVKNDPHRLAAKMIAPLRHAFGLRYHIVGAEHLTVDRAAVIVANHQSSLDILGMLVFWGLMDKVATVAKKILLLCGPFGLGAWLCGTVFIDRAQSGTAKSTVNKAIDEVKEKRVKMWIFPEGTRNNNGSMLPFKKGAFHLAVQNQLPIIPVVYSSYLNFLDSKAKKFGPGDITISALPPISVEGLKPSDVGELAERCSISSKASLAIFPAECLGATRPSQKLSGTSP